MHVIDCLVSQESWKRVKNARQEANRDGRICLLCEASLERLQPVCVLAQGFVVTSRGFHVCVCLAWHGIYYI